MTPKARYQLHNLDAFEWLNERKARSIHAVVTDPPFGVVEFSPDQLSKMESGNGGIWRLPQRYDGHNRSPAPRFTVLSTSDLARINEFHCRLAPLLMKALVPGGHVIIASQNLLVHLVTPVYLAAGFEIRGQVARVVKTLRGGDRPKGAHKDYPMVSVSPRSCWEPWLIFRKPCQGRVRDNLEKWKTGALRRPHLDKPFADLIQSGPARGVERTLAFHPSQKPQAFMRQIVWAALPLGVGVLLDPFMGTGSTIAAAEYHGLKSIGARLTARFSRSREVRSHRLRESIQPT
jgi:hypothetical protein